MRRKEKPLRKQLRQLAVFLVLCAAVAVVWQLARRPSARAKAPTAPPAAPSDESQSATMNAAPAPAHTAPPVRAPVPPPIVDQVIVEKPRVCDGEDSVVEVRAHAANGDNGGLHIVIDGHAGSRVPVQPRFEDDDRRTRPVYAAVFDAYGQMTKVPVPIEVEHCTAERRVAVSGASVTNAIDTYELTARVLDVPTKEQRIRPLPPSQARRFTWRFGDGSPDETSTSPTITHSFAERKQESMYSTFLVEVEAELVDGSRVRGRTAIDFLNVAYETLRDKGVVMLLASNTPRFAERTADGSLEQRARVWHMAKGEVTISQVTAQYTYSDGQPARREVVDPAVLFGTNRIPAGRAVETTLRIAADEDPKVLMVSYDLLGSAADGHPAHGRVTIMRPAPLPTPDNHVAVTDPQLVAKIKAARKILGKHYVSDADIARLEREGRLSQQVSPE